MGATDRAHMRAMCPPQGGVPLGVWGSNATGIIEITNTDNLGQ